MDKHVLVATQASFFLSIKLLIEFATERISSEGYKVCSHEVGSKFGSNSRLVPAMKIFLVRK